MSIANTLINSAVSVLSGLFGFGLFITGGQQAASNHPIIGSLVALFGIILMVFAVKL